jgi:hypothetical protein
MNPKYNQLSRYGAIAKSLPFGTGKAFFLVTSSEAAYNNFQETYPVDADGVVRVCTSWADIITQVQLVTDSSTVIVSPLFTTAPTLTQIDSLNAAKVVVIQAGQNLPDGSYLATKAAVSLATATTIDLFQLNGRIQLISILGEVATTIGAAQTTKFIALPTVGSTTDICAVANTANLAVGAQLSITGTPTAALVATTQAAVVQQASPLVIKAGKIQLNNAATSTGNVRFRVHYKPIDPGAFVSPL